MALKAHKIALRATEKHRSWFAQQCGYERVAFNYGLSDFKDGLSKGELRSGRDLRQILVETGKPNVPRDTRGLPVIGIDVGINTLATLDDGTKYHNPRPLKRYERKLKREQRKLSKKVFRSNNWYKQKRKVERIHYRITCIREHEHHNATTQIVKKASVIGIETLKVTNMLKNRKLAKALSDSALGGFLAKLKTKADVLGVKIVEAPQFFASSKTCSRCGHKKKHLILSDRVYNCLKCGFTEDRDVNAAINLRTIACGSHEI